MLAFRRGIASASRSLGPRNTLQQQAAKIATPHAHLTVRALTASRPALAEEAKKAGEHPTEIPAKPEDRGDEGTRAGPGQCVVEIKELDGLRDMAAKATELQDKLLRSLAEMENVRRRAQVDVENARKFGVQGFAKSLLDVADYLGMALNAVPEEKRGSDADAYLKNLYFGVQATEKELLKAFAAVGLSRVDPMGQKFDPNLHDALFEVDDPTKEPGTVAHVDKPGYVLNERCIRPAKVGVVKKRS
eukprot:tig00001086_g6840.t1